MATATGFGWRRPSLLAALVLGLALCSQGASADPLTTTTLMVDADGPIPTAPMTVQRGQELIVLHVRAPRAVRLEGNVDPDSAARGATNSHFPLTAGQILLGYQERPGTFCTPTSVRGLGIAGPCLIDADRDGRFETIVRGEFNSGAAEQIVLTGSSKVVGVIFDPPMPLPAPVAYTPVAYGEGHFANVRLNWSADRRRYQPDRPIEGSFWFDASARYTGTGIVSRTVPFRFAGEPVTVTIAGVTIRIIGFDRAGAMQFQIVAVQGGTPVEFAFRRSVGVNYIVIYR